jgi:hypothetical protein
VLIPQRAISGVQLVADGAAPGTDININAASGSWWADLDEDRPGEIVGVIARLSTLDPQGNAADGTVDTLRMKVVSLRGYTSANAPTTAAAARAEHLCFDSGSIATPTPSATAEADSETFGGANGDPQPFSGGFRVLVDWTASGGTYDRVLKIAVLYRVAP